MDFSTLKQLAEVYPMLIKPFKGLSDPSDSDITLKINTIVQYLNQIGQVSNDTVNSWNKVMVWTMDEGLTDSVNAKIDDMVAKGTFNDLLTSLTNTLLGSEVLGTVSQDVKGAINEVLGIANANTLALGSEVLATTNKDVKGAINEVKGIADANTASLASIVTLPKDFTQSELKNALLNVPDGGTLKLPKGTYVFNDTVDREFTQGITIIGEKGTVIDATANTNMNLFNFHGSRGVNAPLSTDAVQYANSFQTTLAVSAGDILLITSTDLWDSARSYYYKGEMVEVDSVSGSNVTIRGFLADSYTASTTTVYKLNAPKIIIKDLAIKRNSNHMGLYVQYARNVYLENVSVTGARERCLWVDYCFSGEIINCSASDCWYSGSSTSYGLAITSCQHINVKGGNYLGGRHGLTITGAEPNRYINLDGVMVGNYAQGGTQSLDCHGNTEFINVRGCTILNGLLFSGTSYTITNNRIIASTYITTGLGVQTECSFKNGYLMIENNIINALGSSSAGIDIEAIVPNVTYKEITIRNNIVSSNTQGISLNTKDSTCTGFLIEIVNIENNDVTCNTAYAILLTNNGTTYTHIDKLIIDGGKYVSTGKRALLLSIDSTSDVEIKSATLVSNDSANYAIVVSGARDVTFQSCYIKGLSTTPYSVYNQFNCSGVLKLVNNKFENFSANSAIRYDGSPAASMVILKDNNFNNCSGTVFKGAMPTYSYLNMNGNGIIANVKTGTLTYNGDGSSTSKQIAHGLGIVPTYFHVELASVDAGTAGKKYVTADATNLTVYFNTAPIAGTNNVVMNWKSEVV